MRILFTGDWHLKESTMALAKPVLEFINQEYQVGGYAHFIHGGDLLDEITPATLKMARRGIAGTTGATDGYALIGNHDWDGMENWQDAVFGAGLMVMSEPRFTVTEEGVYLAFLPSPNRAAFGASRKAEGRKARDAAISEALEAALINLETQIGPEQLKKAILFFHGTVAGCDTGTQVLPKGLTWEIPVERLSRWGLAIGSHIHRPQKIGDNIFYAGGLFSQTFGEKAEDYRVLSIEDRPGGGFEVKSISLPRVLIPIEMTFDEGGLHAGDASFGGGDLPGLVSTALHDYCDVIPGL